MTETSRRACGIPDTHRTEVETPVEVVGCLGHVEWLNDYCPNKVVKAAQAISRIRRGSRVFIGTGCGEPQYLIREMVRDVNLQDIVVYQMLSGTLAEYVEDKSFTAAAHP